MSPYALGKPKQKITALQLSFKTQNTLGVYIIFGGNQL